MIANKKFYHCKQIDNGDVSVIEYDTPTLKYGNYQPLSEYYDIVQYGENAQSRWRMFVPINQVNEYRINDLLYFDEAVNTIDLTQEHGTGANARITALLPQNRMLRIEIERIVER